jgi:hypothetical protein
LTGYEFQNTRKAIKGEIDFDDVGEYFFKDRFGHIAEQVDFKKVDQIYNEYVNVMSQVHKRLNAHFKRVISECFSGDKQNQLGSFVIVKTLTHPGDNEEIKESFEDFKSLGDSQSDSSDSESQQLFKKKSNLAPNRPAGDMEEGKRASLYIESSPQPHNNGDAIQTPSMTFEEVSVNEEFMEHEREDGRIDNEHDVIKVGSIQVLNTKDKKFMNKKIKAFSERVPTQDPSTVGRYIINDLAKISNQIKKVWYKVIKAIQIEPRFLIENLKMDYEVKHMEKIGQCIFMSTIETDDFVSPVEENLFDIHQDFFKTREGKGYHLNLSSIIVQDSEIWKKPDSHPIIFEE